MTSEDYGPTLRETWDFLVGFKDATQASFGRVETDISALKTDVRVLKAEVADIRIHLGRIDRRLVRLDDRVSVLAYLRRSDAGCEF